MHVQCTARKAKMRLNESYRANAVGRDLGTDAFSASLSQDKHKSGRYFVMSAF
jgi:hypothetical protein